MSRHSSSPPSFARWPELHKPALMLDHLLEPNPGWDLLAEFEAEMVARPCDVHERAAGDPEFAPYVNDFADRVYQTVTSLLALSAALRPARGGVHGRPPKRAAAHRAEMAHLGTGRLPSRVPGFRGQPSASMTRWPPGPPIATPPT